jgi:hypothetical protein
MSRYILDEETLSHCCMIWSHFDFWIVGQISFPITLLGELLSTDDGLTPVSFPLPLSARLRRF